MLTRLAIRNPGTRSRFKMSAGLVYRRQLVATGVNSYKSHPLMCSPGYKNGQIFMHAEVDCIRNSLKLIDEKDLSQASLFIVRVKRNRSTGKWQHGLAKPCQGCTRMITSFDIESLWWTQDELFSNEFTDLEMQDTYATNKV